MIFNNLFLTKSAFLSCQNHDMCWFVNKIAPNYVGGINKLPADKNTQKA